MSSSRAISSLTTVLVVFLMTACMPDDAADDDQPGVDTLGDTVSDTLGADTAGDMADSLTVENVDFSTPESVLHDEQADVYLVSNINGEPAAKDGNGFISRLSPSGEIEELKWIDGEAEGVDLHAPKGMALSGDTLFVSDIDSVRAFNRSSGEPLGALGVPDASFLNDLATGPDGTLYVTDTGVDETMSPAGTDAIYRFENGEATAVAQGTDLSNPNGIIVDDEGIVMVPFGGSTVHRIPTDDGERSEIATLPAGQLDGVVQAEDGTFLVSSWEGSAVYRVSPEGEVDTVMEDVEAPADIGWDDQRQRLLVPLFMGNGVEIRTIR